MRPTLALLAAAAAIAAGGCGKSNPCRTLASRVCAEMGAEHPACVGRLESAPAATDDERETCGRDLNSDRFGAMIRAIRALDEALAVPITPDAGTAAGEDARTDDSPQSADAPAAGEDADPGDLAPGTADADPAVDS